MATETDEIKPLKTDQKNKAGNQGDVLKHPALIAVAEEVLKETPNGLPFAYAETHTGYAEYKLPKHGSWEEGVGKLHQALHLSGDNTVLTRYLSLSAHGFNANLYGEDTTKKYCGSSLLVDRLMWSKSNNILFTMVLHENEEAPYADLVSNFGGLPTHAIVKSDGYKGVTVLCSRPRPPSLVLVDPFRVEDEQSDIRSLLSLMLERDISFLCWTPRVGCMGKSIGLYPEFPKYVAFQEWAKGKGMHPVLCQWAKPQPYMWGCCLLTNPRHTIVVNNVARSVCEEVGRCSASRWTASVSY